MKVYIDTGIFFDYLIKRSSIESILRKTGRRTRNNDQLYEDVISCFNKFRKHEIMTSSITLYEAEDAMYNQLLIDNKGTPNMKKLLLISSRAVISQVQYIIKYYNIYSVELTNEVFDKLTTEKSLQFEGIKIGDSIHCISATLNDAELIITGDQHIINLDGVLINSKGQPIRCVDTDQAKNIL